MKRSLFWLCFFAVVVAASAAIVGFLYGLKTPFGSVFAEAGVKVYYLRSWTAHVGTLGFGLLFFMLLDFAFAKKFPKYLVPIVSVVLSVVYLLGLVFDNEIYRWMNTRLTLNFLQTYVGAATELSIVGMVFKGGALSFILDALVLVAVAVGGGLLMRALAKCKARSWFVVVPSIVIAGVSIFCFAYTYGRPLHGRERLERVRPFYVHIYNDIQYRKIHAQKPDDFEFGIKVLGGNPEAEYPFYHEEPAEDSSLQAFKALPLEQKPDIIFVTVESLRGWVADVRNNYACENLPHLCSLAKGGTFFPYMYSVGFPSTEGVMGSMLGIWSHPERCYTTYHVNSRSLPSILRDAGYYSVVLPASNPNFDNFTALFGEWFDVTDYNPANAEDMKLAKRFLEVYNNRPKDKPFFINFMTLSTHAPFVWPESIGETPDDMGKRYEGLARYMDSALGVVMDAVAKDPRGKNTVFVLTGDHSFDTGAQKDRISSVGNAHNGRVWTTGIFYGMGIPEGVVRTEMVSHVDIAPTIIELLNLKVANHFVGRNILADSIVAPRYSIVQKQIVAHEGGLHLYADMDDSTRAIVLQAETTPQWDTANWGEGFVGESPADFTTENRKRVRELRAAVRAYGYLLDHDRIYPAK